MTRVFRVSLPGCRARYLVAIAILCGWLESNARSLGAAQPAATSSREARDDAARAIPYAKLSRDGRIKVSRVLAATTIYRRLPTQTIECDANLYVFLVEHPDLVVNIWEALGISEVSVERLSDAAFTANDKAGTLGRMEYLYRTPDLHLVYAEGSYDGPLFGRTIKGQSLLMLRSQYYQTAEGRRYVRCRLDAFLHLENVGVGVLAKTFQPLVGAAADHNFRETANFLAGVSRAAEVNYAGMQRMAEKLDNVSDEDRERFVALTEQMAVRAALLQTAQARTGGASVAPAGTPVTRSRSATVRRPTAGSLQR